MKLTNLLFMSRAYTSLLKHEKNVQVVLEIIFYLCLNKEKH